MTIACPAIERLAAAASGEDDAVLGHLDHCADCQHALEEQASVRLLLGRTPEAPLSRARREALGAEIMAHADRLPSGRRARIIPIVAIVAAAAAAIVIIVATRTDPPPARAPIAAPTPPDEKPIVTPLPPAPPREEPVVVEVAPAPVPAPIRRAKLAGTADYAHEMQGDREVVKLTGGELSVDAIGARPIRVVTGDTRIAVKQARIKIIATRGVIEQVSVFAGSAEVVVGGKTHIIEAGMVWERDAGRDEAIAAFREGWTALREARHADAIAAFDRATDPVVAEDAVYWSAVASERAKDTGGAIKRYQQLVDTFPKSPRVEEAKTALGRLVP